jgi:hypothetical protein
MIFNAHQSQSQSISIAPLDSIMVGLAITNRIRLNFKGSDNDGGKPHMSEHSATVSTTEENIQIISDNCPEWATTIIARILVLEIEAGTIKNPANAERESAWATSSLDELSKVAAKLDRDDLQDLSQEVEALFERLTRGLVSEGFSPESVAGLINARIPTGCRLPYCNAAEVAAATS